MGDDMVNIIIQKIKAQNRLSSTQPDISSQLPFFSNGNSLAPVPPPAEVVPASSEPPPSKPRSSSMEPSCIHSGLEMSLDPCLTCSSFCNCWHINYEKPPDVLVRSVDNKIVRLSGWMVRASRNLHVLAIEAVKNKRGGGASLQQERMIIQTDDNSARSAIKYSLDPEYLSSESPKKASKLQDESIVELEDKVLVLFDTESSRPTLGITEKVLLKVDYFVCQHLDEVDMRVKRKQISEKFYSETRHVEPPDADLLHSFKYEDWEEEFFNVDAQTFYEIFHATYELVIFDLEWTLLKWSMLNRGFPLGMVNGMYDLINDPDYMNFDRKNSFGLYDSKYRNPKVYCRHKSGSKFEYDERDFIEPKFIAKWWVLKWVPNHEFALAKVIDSMTSLITVIKRSRSILELYLLDKDD